MPVTITKKQRSRTTTFMVEFDADRFERVAAALGMFSDEFLASIKQSEKEIKSGKTKAIKSLRDIK